jgi:hypothetical protein
VAQFELLVRSGTSSRANTPAIGTSNSPRATRSANSATTAAVAASARLPIGPATLRGIETGDGVYPVGRESEVFDRHGDISTTEEIQQGVDVSGLCCGAQ